MQQPVEGDDVGSLDVCVVAEARLRVAVQHRWLQWWWKWGECGLKSGFWLECVQKVGSQLFHHCFQLVVLQWCC
jgi:hypothetical protein